MPAGGIGSRKGAHEVGRTSRRHVPHGVPQRMIGKERRTRSGKALPQACASRCAPAEDWLPKRKGAHEVGRTSRRHVPRSVSQRMIGPEKEGAHEVGRTSHGYLPRSASRRKIGSRKGKAPTKWEGPPVAICLTVCPGGEPYLQKTSLTASRNL